jgi:alternative squalene epoxidase
MYLYIVFKIIKLKLKLWFYRKTHKPHHRFINPKYFDAFNGSLGDTFFMILVPLFITKYFIHTNVWTYMVFGSLYANWLCLIHRFGHVTYI